MAAQGEQLFGTSSPLTDAKVQEFFKQSFAELISSIAETVSHQLPDSIREAGVSEAVFSHEGDSRYTLATDSLATCIGVAGYDPVNRFGFVVHFADECEVEKSGALLMGRVHTYREQNGDAPLFIHLRGGIQGMSEPLLAKIKQWLNSSALPTIIASENTLQSPIAPGIGLPKIPASIKLDVRTGTCETYAAETNPYSYLNEQRDAGEAAPHFTRDLFIQASQRRDIRIVYDPKHY